MPTLAVVAEPLSLAVPVPAIGSDDEKFWPPIQEARRDNAVAASELVAWLNAGPQNLRRLYVRTPEGNVRLREAPRLPAIVRMFTRAVDHPDVQKQLEAICSDYGI